MDLMTLLINYIALYSHDIMVEVSYYVYIPSPSNTFFFLGSAYLPGSSGRNPVLVNLM